MLTILLSEKMDQSLWMWQSHAYDHAKKEPRTVWVQYAECIVHFQYTLHTKEPIRDQEIKLECLKNWKQNQVYSSFQCNWLQIHMNILKNGFNSVGGGTQMLRNTGIYRPNGLVLYQKSLDKGTILVEKILRRGPHITKIAKNCKISCFWGRKSLSKWVPICEN